MPVSELVSRFVTDQHEIEGITISGGEPLYQSEGLFQLLSGMRASTSLSIILFTGFTITEILNMPLGKNILANIDVLIDGIYDSTQHLAYGFRSSSNQVIHLLTNRYSMIEIEQAPVGEILIDSDGNISISGINPPRVYKSI